MFRFAIYSGSATVVGGVPHIIYPGLCLKDEWPADKRARYCTNFVEAVPTDHANDILLYGEIYAFSSPNRFFFETLEDSHSVGIYYLENAHQSSCGCPMYADVRDSLCRLACIPDKTGASRQRTTRLSTVQQKTPPQPGRRQQAVASGGSWITQATCTPQTTLAAAGGVLQG